MFLEILIICILGLIIGSFLNMVIYRLREPALFSKKRSFCPHCRANIRFWDLVPVFSYIWLRARCRTCKKSISLQYPLVELATAILFVLFYFKFGITLLLAGNLILLCLLIIIFVYDLQWGMVFDAVVFPGIVVALLLSFVSHLDVLDLFIGLIVGGGFFFAQHILSKGRWIGTGDITVGLLIGAILGWPLVVVALFLSYVIGALTGIGLIVSGKATRRSHVPFAPFLVIGTVITMLYGEYLLQQYFTFI